MLVAIFIVGRNTVDIGGKSGAGIFKIVAIRFDFAIVGVIISLMLNDLMCF